MAIGKSFQQPIVPPVIPNFDEPDNDIDLNVNNDIDLNFNNDNIRHMLGGDVINIHQFDNFTISLSHLFSTPPVIPHQHDEEVNENSTI